jgi:hypothetical protein
VTANGLSRPWKSRRHGHREVAGVPEVCRVVLVWDDAGQTKVSYYAPAELAARHRFGPGLAGNLAAIGTLTDALVAP